MGELPLANLVLPVGSHRGRFTEGRVADRDGVTSVAVTAASGAGLLAVHRTHLESGRVVAKALVDGLGTDHADVVAAGGVVATLGPPVRPTEVVPSLILRRRYVVADGLSYGPEGKRNLLDVWRSQDLPAGGRAPVMLQIPGGGWVYNDRRYQAYPLLSALVKAGWVCVSINYRVSPRRHLARSHRRCQAGHRLGQGQRRGVRRRPGLRRHHRRFGRRPPVGPGRPDRRTSPSSSPASRTLDTSVQAGVHFYAPYDLRDWTGQGGPKQSVRHVERFVLKSSPETDAERWRRASPIHWVRPDAPPMMLIHGTTDSLVPVERAATWLLALRNVSRQPVVYVELPGAQHAFDSYASLRTRYTVRGVEQFLAYVRTGHLVSGAGRQSVTALSSSNEADSASA